VTLPYKLKIKSRTVEVRRLGIKIRTYQNVKVFLGGTAGRGSGHWAAFDFKECMESPEEITYFSGDNGEVAIAAHGCHVHIIFRRGDSALDSKVAEEALKKFIEKLRQKGVAVELERG